MFHIVLFKDSNCDLCKLMQKELIDNPPSADVTIIHVKHSFTDSLTLKSNITEYPTIIVYDEEEHEVARYTGFIDSDSINKLIDEKA